MEEDRERAALLARQAYFLNQRYQGDVIGQIDKALRTILHPSESEQNPDINRLVEQVCQKVEHKVTLTPEEWGKFVGRGIPYEPCPEQREPDETPRIHLRSEQMKTDDPLTLSLNLYEESFGWKPKRYVDNDFEERSEVIVDHTTGLMWQKSGSQEELTYEAAQAYIEELNSQNFAGYSDWRLPTVPELMSLLESERPSNDLFIEPIFDATQSWVWSADIRQIKGEVSSSAAWGVRFDRGDVGWRNLDGGFYVRAVRS